MRTIALATLPFLLLASCGSSDSGGDEPSCIGAPFADQPQRRFPVGSTYYLPALAAECGAAVWVLESAPSGNDNQVVAGADGVWRFTPHVTGPHVFRIEGGQGRWTLGVIDGAEVPFHNYNYYPSRSLARVGDQVWVANAASPTVTPIDPDDLTAGAPIAVGPWPVALAWTDGMPLAVVAQRAGDTLGLIDVARGHIVDAIHVGDEPANVVVGPDGTTAYVALQTEGVVAVVDLEERAVVDRIEAGRDLLGMAISRDGDRLFVASHRSGKPNRYPYEPDPVDEERDIIVIDTASAAVVDVLVDVAATIKALHTGEDGRTLFAAVTQNDTEASLLDEEQPNFVHEVLAFDIESGELRMRVDLAGQPGSGGPVAFAHGMA